MTQEEIKQKMLRILEKNQHWKDVQDGSFEMALSADGYYELLLQLDDIVETKKE